jgi:hypothetical protein
VLFPGGVRAKAGPEVEEATAATTAAAETDRIATWNSFRLVRRCRTGSGGNPIKLLSL